SAAPGIRAGNSAAEAHSRLDPGQNWPELFCWRHSNCRACVFAFEQEGALGGYSVGTDDSTDSIVDLPADARCSAKGCGCAELLLRHASFQRSHPAVGKLD